MPTDTHAVGEHHVETKVKTKALLQAQEPQKLQGTCQLLGEWHRVGPPLLCLGGIDLPMP